MSTFSDILRREQVKCEKMMMLCTTQRRKLESYVVSSLTQRSVARHVASLGHNILIPSQTIFALFPRSVEAANSNIIVFGWNTRSITHEGSKRTITPPMRLMIPKIKYLYKLLLFS